MTDAQYNQYLNLHTFAKHWRKYTRTAPKQDKETFRREMQYNKYVRLDYFSDVSGRAVLIYLLAKGSKYAEHSQELKKLLARIKDPSDVILVSENPFKVYSVKVINSYKHLRIKTYLHENFVLIIPNGPLCSKHEIMSSEEVVSLLNNELFCYLVNLPKILDSDPQCIWIGAEVGDVVKITSHSDISGEYIQYKVVVAKNGRVISFRDMDQNTNQEDEEPEDEEIQELRENAMNDMDDDYDTEEEV